MDMGIVNAGKLPLYEDIEPELRNLLTEIVLNKSENDDHVERLIAYA
jgi:5-methyltetrahydrofolate--homocysteine methyltransferase